MKWLIHSVAAFMFRIRRRSDLSEHFASKGVHCRFVAWLLLAVVAPLLAPAWRARNRSIYRPPGAATSGRGPASPAIGAGYGTTSEKMASCSTWI